MKRFHFKSKDPAKSVKVKSREIVCIFNFSLSFKMTTDKMGEHEDPG